uniref:Uncharacterized protein n=1 Tax=Anguilla anguilla TaxID=7936 RepID=A0A0E9W014_ANGAN
MLHSSLFVEKRNTSLSTGILCDVTQQRSVYSSIQSASQR